MAGAERAGYDGPQTMWITFQCYSCDSKLEIDATSTGSRVQCPTCQSWVVVPRKGIEPGTTIGGFRIIRLLGRGGMAEVYLAKQLSMDRPVALKILARSLTQHPEAVQSFVREIRLTAKLHHPYLVTAYDAGEDHGILFMAMAYINGPSLHVYVRQRGALEQTESVSLALKTATALSYAWREHRLLHRDVKPGNILLDSKGQPHLADLGLAKTLSENADLRSKDGPVGTPNYMSPEQAEGRELDCRTDIYGLGATLYTMVTGRIPYESKTSSETLRRLATEPLPDPRVLNAGLRPAFVEGIARMLARDPAERWRDWDTVCAELKKIQSPALALKSSVSPPRSHIRWMVLGVLTLALLGGIVLGRCGG